MARSKKSNDSKVLQEALSVIIELGPDSFTLRDISRKTKLAPSTLIQRFQSKEKLLVAALVQANEDLTESSRIMLKGKQDSGIGACIEFLVSLSKGLQRDNLGEHVALLAKDFSIPRLNKMARERMEVVRNTLRTLLRQSIEKGELRSGVDLEELVYGAEAVWHGSMVQWGFLAERSLGLWVRDRLASFFDSYRVRKCQ